MGDEQKTRAIGWLGWLAFTLVVLYPLSFGAADCILGRSGPKLQAALSALYYPISLLGEKSKIAGRFCERNALFWHGLFDARR